MKSEISGLHHVTAIAGPPQRNLDFYAGVLGLRLVKRTVNFDDPGTYHFPSEELSRRCSGASSPDFLPPHWRLRATTEISVRNDAIPSSQQQRTARYVHTLEKGSERAGFDFLGVPPT